MFLEEAQQLFLKGFQTSFDRNGCFLCRNEIDDITRITGFCVPIPKQTVGFATKGLSGCSTASGWARGTIGVQKSIDRKAMGFIFI